MRLDSTHEPFYGPGETKPKGMEALQATGNLIVQKSRQHAFENFLYFYETKNDVYHGKIKKIQVIKLTTILDEVCTICTQTKLQMSG